MAPIQPCIRFASLALVGVCLLAAPATAQPTKQQQDALRSSCRSDYMANCMSVKPGGAEALQCLKRNMAKLSPGCQSAVSALSPPAAPPQQATMPPPAPVTAPPPATAVAPAAAPPPRAAVPPPPRAAASPPPPKPARAAPAAAAKAAIHPNAQQQAALRQSCQSDFMARCKGIQPGGADAMRCLQRNASSLSPRCQGALSMLGGGAPAAMSAPEAAAAPAVTPSAEQIAAIKFTCRRDVMLHCRAVARAGGPEVMACLLRNGPRLTPDCRTSIAAVAEDAPGGAAASAPPPPPAAGPPPFRPGPPGPLRRAIRERMMDR